MKRRLIDQFDAILLDQGQTFMFENDRFGAGIDYFSTYVQLGGQSLTVEQLNHIIEQLFRQMLALSRNPAHYDSFPSVSRVLQDFAMGVDLCDADIQRLESLVALHEVGTISGRHAATLRSFCKTHRLGIVSNIWGNKLPFEENLKRAGVFQCFEHIIWSSDHGCIKPSAKLFGHALQRFKLSPSRILFVGDHPMRDVDASKTLGCYAVWVRNGDGVYPEGLRTPDLVVTDLEELLSAEQGAVANGRAGHR